MSETRVRSSARALETGNLAPQSLSGNLDHAGIIRPIRSRNDIDQCGCVRTDDGECGCIRPDIELLNKTR